MVGDDGRRLKEGVICNTGAKEHTSDRNEAFPARPNEQAQTGICLGRRPPLEDVIVGISGCDTGESRAKARESLASPEITFCACTNHCPCSPFSFQYGTLISGVKGCSLTIMPGTKRYSSIACTMKRFLLARTRSLPASLLADDQPIGCPCLATRILNTFLYKAASPLIPRKVSSLYPLFAFCIFSPYCVLAFAQQSLQCTSTVFLSQRCAPLSSLTWHLPHLLVMLFIDTTLACFPSRTLT